MVYVCPGSEIFPPATAAALNPATPPLRTITWIWTEQWTWKKFGSLAEIAFLQVLSRVFVFSEDPFLFWASEVCIGPRCRPGCVCVVFSRLWFLQFLVSPAGIQTLGEREGGKRSVCLKVCGRHVTSTMLTLISDSEAAFKWLFFEFRARGPGFFPHSMKSPRCYGSKQTRKDTKVQKGGWWGGGWWGQKL